MTFEKKDIDENKTMAMLSYIGILFLIPMLAKKDSAFCQAHAKQGMVLFIAAVVLGWIPVIGQILLLGVVVVAIMSIVKTLNGEYWPIPVLDDLSKKLNF